MLCLQEEQTKKKEVNKMFWKKDRLTELEKYINERLGIYKDRLNKLEDKFTVNHYKLKPVTDNWRELFRNLDKIKKEIKRYNPADVGEIVITSECVKIMTYHRPQEEIIKTKKPKSKNKRGKNNEKTRQKKRK